ncbi:hypothetical protein HZH68_016203 [Vespula germanica]|uniref:Uncharacterized protein n=1 Tax=Vespula germanica TaxID=30212 RepID=A0A834J195_VESGE|nr:hypothetical protein HZH68_016203 [Vespula germanica]
MGEIRNDKKNLMAINNDFKKENLGINAEDEEEVKGSTGDEEVEGELKPLTFGSFDKIPFSRTTLPSFTKLRHIGLTKLHRQAEMFYVLFPLPRYSQSHNEHSIRLHKDEDDAGKENDNLYRAIIQGDITASELQLEPGNIKAPLDSYIDQFAHDIIFIVTRRDRKENIFCTNNAFNQRFLGAYQAINKYGAEAFVAILITQCRSNELFQ